MAGLKLWLPTANVWLLSCFVRQILQNISTSWFAKILYNCVNEAIKKQCKYLRRYSKKLIGNLLFLIKTCLAISTEMDASGGTRMSCKAPGKVFLYSTSRQRVWRGASGDENTKPRCDSVPAQLLTHHGTSKVARCQAPALFQQFYS